MREDGDPQRPTILCVHGYPDDHAVWDGVVEQLRDRFHLVRYDVRGAGASDAPEQRSGYALEQLAGDLLAVADEVSPSGPVHLLAHDWGSIQAWHAVTEPRAKGRVSSFTSISGPSLDQVGAWFAARLRQPSLRGLGEALNQLALAGYTGLFQVPVLPEIAWRTGLLPRLVRAIQREDPAAPQPPLPPAEDGVRGLALYRQNMFSGESREPVRTDVPVQVLAPRGDVFVTPAAQASARDWTDDLVVHELSGGHWLPRSRPQVVAGYVAEHVERVDPAAGVGVSGA